MLQHCALSTTSSFESSNAVQEPTCIDLLQKLAQAFFVVKKKGLLAEKDYL
jgi:hypothetical protein